ncbi:hypothetical protein [Pseudoalteromonas piratica]|uniref:CBM11 domain-containing protein n=1 Tax=Pseudoalteromonas piratica TaxID=1348114 RepID=A0A0A7EBP7_9GAMM|nr:hypothetical protein [Pseudoalteromonas piratica]AIY64045.1 hypothetical protein OM33_01910 [Pseudoalteromonas piratica]
MYLKSLLTAILFSSFSLNATQSLDAKQWRFAVDPHGSTASYEEPLVKKDYVGIAFNRVPRVDKQNNSWVELIYDLPKKSLEGITSIEITYQSDKPLVVKLSQKDYGGTGDKSYAHYQTILPSANKWQTHSLTFDNFSRPKWTPSWSKDKGVTKANVSALYFVPNLTDEKGGNAWLKIKKVKLQ